MTHFTALIIGNDIEKKMAPFDENMRVDPYIKYSISHVVRDKRRLGYKRNCIEISKLPIRQFIDEWYGLESDDHGNAVSTYNPNSKWDWYRIGGRWDGLLMVNGIGKNQALKGEISFNEDFRTYAVITDDGEWHSPGEMGWFACSSESEEDFEIWKKDYYNRFIKELPEDTLLTIVDCHI